jgi:murein DD-endopeptidase MepM/ murein hydrolase activator NlpD
MVNAVRLYIYSAALFGAVFVLALAGVFVHAQSVEELENKINSRQGEIEQLEQEIKEYEQELTTIRREKQTLQSAVRELDVSRRKLQSSITLTEKNIEGTQGTINKLSGDIADKEGQIQRNADALGEAIRRMNETESDTFIEILLGGDGISSVWTDIDALYQFQGVVRGKVNELEAHKVELEKIKEESEAEQQQLVSYKTDLTAQKRGLDINRGAKNELLEQTQNKESNYQDVLEDKRRAKEEFEAELREFEAQLKYQLDPSKVPAAGKGVLRWPLSKITITQYFGNTKFAQSGAYNGQGHNGMDFAASIGTPVYASLAGSVIATGDTDAHNGCYSYGKWILIRHGNGLSTLYAHLSEFAVNQGQGVTTGSVIGYSGNTGYSTGPHLHLTVYASDAVQIVRLGDIKTRTNCADARIPVSAPEGYLNPLDYL